MRSCVFVYDHAAAGRHAYHSRPAPPWKNVVGCRGPSGAYSRSRGFGSRPRRRASARRCVRGRDASSTGGVVVRRRVRIEARRTAQSRSCGPLDRPGAALQSVRTRSCEVRNRAPVPAGASRASRRWRAFLAVMEARGRAPAPPDASSWGDGMCCHGVSRSPGTEVASPTLASWT